MKSNFSTSMKCAKCKVSPTTLHSKICGDCAYGLALTRKCQVCQASPVVAFSSGYTTNFCQIHAMKGLEDALIRKSRLVGVIKSAQDELDKARDDAQYYRKRYYELRDREEDLRLEGVRKRMKSSYSDLTQKELEEITKALYE